MPNHGGFSALLHLQYRDLKDVMGWRLSVDHCVTITSEAFLVHLWSVGTANEAVSRGMFSRYQTTCN